MQKYCIPFLTCLLVLCSAVFLQAAPPADKTLVVYFSHTGNTQLLATYIQEITGGDMYEIVPVDPYPEDDREAHEVGKKELNEGYNPPLQGSLPDMTKYEVVFVGSPNWFSTYATPVRTFLIEADLSGKTVVPFITYKGTAARYYDEVAALCPESTMLEGFGVKGEEVENSRDAVAQWLETLFGQ